MICVFCVLLSVYVNASARLKKKNLEIWNGMKKNVFGLDISHFLSFVVHFD